MYYRYIILLLAANLFSSMSGAVANENHQDLDSAIARMEVPFLFTEDQVLSNTNFIDELTPSRALGDNAFLNAPLTRFDYILIKMEDELNVPLSIDIAKTMLRKAFGRVVPPHRGIDITGQARFMKESGKVIVSYTARGLGEPKVPMNQTCTMLMKYLLSLKFPQRLLGYTYHNTVLGVLAREEADVYTPVLAALAKNVVHVVKLESSKNRSHHFLTCAKEHEGAPVKFGKFSFELEPFR